MTGATAVGESNAARKALQTFWRRAVPTAYVDLGRLGFVHPGPDPDLHAADFAAL